MQFLRSSKLRDGGEDGKTNCTCPRALESPKTYMAYKDIGRLEGEECNDKGLKRNERFIYFHPPLNHAFMRQCIIHFMCGPHIFSMNHTIGAYAPFHMPTSNFYYMHFASFWTCVQKLRIPHQEPRCTVIYVCYKHYDLNLEEYMHAIHYI